MEKLKKIFFASQAISLSSKAFDLASKGKFDECIYTLHICRNKYQLSGQNLYRIEIDILSSFVHMKKNEFDLSKKYLKYIFTRIKRSNEYNIDEKKYLTVYSLYILESVKNSSSKRIIKNIKNSIEFDRKNIRKNLLMNFPLVEIT